MTQRDKMRELYRKVGDKLDRIVSEYAEAEERGEVRRTSNERGLSAIEYAERLLADGLRKGWIR